MQRPKYLLAALCLLLVLAALLAVGTFSPVEPKDRTQASPAHAPLAPHTPSPSNLVPLAPTEDAGSRISTVSGDNTPADTAPATIVDTNARELVVICTNDNGTSIAECKVQVTLYGESAESIIATSGKAGRTIINVPREWQRVYVVAEHDSEGRSGRLLCRVGDDTAMTLVLYKLVALHGHVTLDSGPPGSGALVTLTPPTLALDTPCMESALSTIADDNGSFSFSVLPVTCIATLRATLSGNTSNELRVNLADSQAEHALTILDGTYGIRGVLSGAGDASGITVLIRDINKGTSPRKLTLDKDGRFSYLASQPGRFDIVAGNLSSVSARVESVELTRESSWASVSIAMVDTASIKGHISRADGTAIPEAKLYCIPESTHVGDPLFMDSSFSRLIAGHGGLSNAEGLFSVDGLHPLWTYQLCCVLRSDNSEVTVTRQHVDAGVSDYAFVVSVGEAQGGSAVFDIVMAGDQPPPSKAQITLFRRNTQGQWLRQGKQELDVNAGQLLVPGLRLEAEYRAQVAISPGGTRWYGPWLAGLTPERARLSFGNDCVIEITLGGRTAQDNEKFLVRVEEEQFSGPGFSANRSLNSLRVARFDQVPEGSYRVSVRSDATTPQVRTIQCIAGETTRVTFDM